MYRIRNTNKTKHRSIYIQNQYNKQTKTNRNTTKIKYKTR